jgi:TRAP-type C4-dicarboxylate transport system substrate-binding protein
MRVVSRLLIGLSALLFVTPAIADREIRIGTLAPKKSPWGKVFQVWQDAVAEQTEGALTLTFYWNGSQGDDLAMVDKIKAGSQLDGAAVSALGLARIWKPILALQIPGLFRTQASLDRARESMKPDIDAKFAEAGFVLAGGGDVGISHLMSKGFAVRTPDDLKGRHPVVWNEDVIGPTLFRVIGGVTPTPMTVPAVLPGLRTGTVDVVSVPAIVATQLQWAALLDHIVEQPGGVTMGGLVMKKATLDALPPDHRRVLEDTGKVTGTALRERVRKADEAAFESMKKRMTVVTHTPEDIQKWTDVLTKTIEELGRGTFDPELLKKLAGMRGLGARFGHP